jgi:hypothetical protein
MSRSWISNATNSLFVRKSLVLHDRRTPYHALIAIADVTTIAFNEQVDFARLFSHHAGCCRPLIAIATS